ncbi:N-acetyltransferase family protein [Rhizobium mongolense]|uniref:N-acetyltransferase family protein n=1 Tax=Rhizobium mongolense TaxID=57676 RepID=UPI0034A0DCE1
MSGKTSKRRGFGARREFTVVLGEVDGKIAAICIYFPMFSTWMGNCTSRICSSTRNSGAFGLVKKGCATASNDGYHYLRLTVDHGNHAAARFYLRHGFEPANDETSYRLYGPAFHQLCQNGN